MAEQNGMGSAENTALCVFGKTYKFEGKEIEKVDLAGMENVTASDMIAVNRVMAVNGSPSYNQELSMEYALRMAARVSGIPYEFYEKLNMSDAFKVRRIVQSFF